MTLLGTLVFVMTPRDDFRSFNLEMAVERIEQDLRYAHELALTTNTSCGINFLANGSYTLFQGNQNTPATNPFTRQAYTLNLSDSFRNVNILNNRQVEFDPLGRPTLGSGQTVQIGDGQSTVSLLIIPNTGVVVRQ